MDQVAQAADVSRATLFNYYPGKAALLGAMAGSLEDRLVSAVTHYRSKHADARDALRQLFAHAGRVLDQTADLTRLLMLTSARPGGFPQLQAALAELAREGQRQGHWRADLSADSIGECLYLAFLAGLLGWAGNAATHPADSPAAVFSRRADDLLQLLAAP